MTAILFDLDRTLVDVQTFTDYGAALAEVEDLLGRGDDPPTPPTGWDGPTRKSMGILVALAGDPRWEEVSNVIARHELAAVDASRPMPGVVRALELVAKRPVAVVTLLPDEAARLVLARHQLVLPVVVGRRPDLAVKPAPDQLQAACSMLGVATGAAVMVGDSTWDAEAARRAGCGFIGVTNGAEDEFPPEVRAAPTVDAAVDLALGA